MNRRKIQIPLPNPSEVALVISNGAAYVSGIVDRMALENVPEEAAREFLKQLDGQLENLARTGFIDGSKDSTPDVLSQYTEGD